MMTVLVPVYVSLAIAVNYFGAVHEPTPHHVKIAIVGARSVTVPIAHELSVMPPGGFDVSQLTSVAPARRLLAERELAGAYVPSLMRPEAIVASAASPSLAQFVEGVFRQAAARQGLPLTVLDVRPMPPGDPTGTPNFFFLIICTLAGFLVVAVLGLAAPDLPEGQRLALAAAASVLAPTIAYLIGGPGYGAFSGDVGTMLAMLGMGILYTFAVAGTTRIMQLAFGMAAMLPASLVLIFLNIPTSGGPLAPQLMPGFWRFLNHFWIGAIGIDANRSILYFGGAGVGNDVLKLFAWIAAWGVILALPIYRRSAVRRRRGAAPVAARVPQAA